MYPTLPVTSSQVFAFSHSILFWGCYDSALPILNPLRSNKMEVYLPLWMSQFPILIPSKFYPDGGGVVKVKLENEEHYKTGSNSESWIPGLMIFLHS